MGNKSLNWKVHSWTGWSRWHWTSPATYSCPLWEPHGHMVAQKLCFCTCEQVLWGLALNALMALYDQRPFIISKYFWRLQPQILYHLVPTVLRLASMRKVPGETIENLNNLTYLGRHLLAKADISNDIIITCNAPAQHLVYWQKEHLKIMMSSQALNSLFISQ